MLLTGLYISYQGNPFWKLVRNLLKTPGKDQVECHSPKPILLDTGEMKEPYDWAVWLLSLSFNNSRQAHVVPLYLKHLVHLLFEF